MVWLMCRRGWRAQLGWMVRRPDGPWTGTPLWAIVPRGGTGGHNPPTGPHPATKPWGPPARAPR